MSVFVATETGTLTLPDGSFIDIREGVTHLNEGDPFLAAHPVFFVPVEDRIANDGWEQATAAPGEKRKRAPKVADPTPEPEAAPESQE